MRRRIPCIAALLIAACVGSPRARPDAAIEKIYLWQVSHAQRPGRAHVLGSVHLERPDRPEFDRVITDAFAQARMLSVELDLQGDAGQEIVPATMKYGMYPEGQTLEGALGAERSARVRAALAKHQIELPPRARPWLVYYMLVLGGSEQAGLSAGMGIDVFFTRWARGQKPIASLETADQQLAILASLPEPAQIRMLDEGIDEFDEQQKKIQEIIDAYRSGDDHALLGQVQEATDDPEVAAYLERLLDERNARMAAKLDEWLGQPGKIFVVVGVFHLLGEKSVIAELEKLGYRADRVRPSGERVAIELPKEEIDTRQVVGHSIGVAGLEAPAATSPSDGGMRTAHAVVDGITYVLSISPILPSAIALGSTGLFDAVETGITQQSGGEAVTRNDVQLQGFPARRLELQAQKPPLRLRLLLVWAGSQLYTVTAMVPPDPSPEVRLRIDEVLDSFALIVEQ